MPGIELAFDKNICWMNELKHHHGNIVLGWGHLSLNWIYTSQCEKGGSKPRRCFQNKWLINCLLPNHSLHGTDQLLGATFSRVDGRRGGLVEVGLGGSPHFVTVVIRVASFAVANGPVSVTIAAPCWKAGDNCSSDMGTAVLEAKKKVKSIEMNRWGKCGSELEGMDTKGATESGGATDSPNAGRLWPVRVQSELKMKVRSVVYRCGGWKPSTYEWDWVEKPSVKSPQSWGLESSLDYFVLVFQEFSGEIWRKKIKTIPERAHHSTSAQKRMTVTPSIHIQIMLSTAKRTSNTKGREGAALAQVTARPQAGLSTPTRTSCQNLKHAPTDTRVTAKCSKKPFLEPAIVHHPQAERSQKMKWQNWEKWSSLGFRSSGAIVRSAPTRGRREAASARSHVRRCLETSLASTETCAPACQTCDHCSTARVQLFSLAVELKEMWTPLGI